MFVPFFFHHDCTEGIKRALASERHWKQENISRTHSGKSWYTQPGKIIRNAHLLNPECLEVSSDLQVTQAEYCIAEAQEFKTVWYTYDRKDYFNRKSGRYLYSDTKYTYEGIQHDMSFEHRDDVPDILGTKLLEEQR